MFRVTLDNINQQRTIRPLYADHQATSYSCVLDPSFDRSIDVLPGMVMAREEGDSVVPFGWGANAASHEPMGLAGIFVAPKLGVDELKVAGSNGFAVWVGDEQAVFEVLAPAFAASATWAKPTKGQKVPLRVTMGAHKDGVGKLTNEAAGATVADKVVGQLIDVLGNNRIVVSLGK